ncbi:MAG: hypothetical protein IJC99_07160 [Clostridia bacterium]|nr:hypothetical protein [Clostridia bacterium]
MEEKTKESLERELEAAKHLLSSRAKQIKALQEDLAGEAEINRLLVGFLPLLALAAARDGAANEAVRVIGSTDVLGISIEKSALTAVLDAWCLKAVSTEGDYRLAFERVTPEA